MHLITIYFKKKISRAKLSQGVLCQIKLFETNDNFREIVHFESAVIQLTFTYIYIIQQVRERGEEQAFCHLIDQICFLKKQENN